MTDATEWQPGDPLMPDNGCGALVTPRLSDEERDAALAEDDTAPPWWRPEDEGSGLSSTRYCAPCGVRWRGDEPCWMCGGEQVP